MVDILNMARQLLSKNRCDHALDGADRRRQLTTQMQPTAPIASSDDDPSRALFDASQGDFPIAATELQDHLLVATNDLDRLERLLTDAGDALMSHFHGAAAQLRQLRQDVGGRQDIQVAGIDTAMNHLAAAITSLQFQDMASQLLWHTGRRLRRCIDQLAVQAMPSEDEAEDFVDTMPLSPNPVTQDEMDAGSVELF